MKKAAKKRPAKERTKSPKSTVNPSGRRALVPQPHGGALLPGAGGGPQPGSGRPKNEFKDWCAALLDDVANRGQVEAVLADKNHPAFATMFKTIADRAHGRAPQSLDLTSGGKSLGDLIREARERR